MKRPSNFGQPVFFNAKSRSGYTLVEMLVATALTMMLMTAVVTIFGAIGRAVSDSRSLVEACDRLRAAEMRLQMDIDGMTASTPENGYFEIIEGPVGVSMLPSAIAVNKLTGEPDLNVGDFDDVLVFTTHSGGASFSGRYNGGTIESDVAEVAWFVRGNNLYRRVLLVSPGSTPSGSSVYAESDISVHWDNNGTVVANTLADLALRENRYAHGVSWPYSSYWGLWGMPTLSDCSGGGFSGPKNPTPWVPNGEKIDFWEDWLNKPAESMSGTGTGGQRADEDVILTNVIGFDVKVWDILAQRYVDLGGQDAVAFNVANLDQRSGFSANNPFRVYDTWSSRQRRLKDGSPDPSTDGFDNNNLGGIDDASERETAPPYPAPLRGIKVEIRIFEPSSRQIRVVNVIGEFLPK